MIKMGRTEANMYPLCKIVDCRTLNFVHLVWALRTCSLAGVIALLAAVDALSRVDGFNEFPKRLVFLVFTGEARGYLGSRQFLAQLKKGNFVDYGLTTSSVRQVLEVGSVGQASQSTFFAHKQATAASASTEQILKSLRLSAAATSSTVKLADASNPGIPPSSLMTFVHNDPSVAGMYMLVRLVHARN